MSVYVIEYRDTPHSPIKVKKIQASGFHEYVRERGNFVSPTFGSRASQLSSYLRCIVVDWTMEESLGD